MELKMKKPQLITVFLPSEFRGVAIDSAYQLNLVEKGDTVEVYFWKPSVQENGKHFLNVSKTNKQAFIEACEG